MREVPITDAKNALIALVRQAEAGKPRTYVDGQIAAIAAANDLVLVTRNFADFNLFKNLRVKDWTSA